MLTLIPLAGVFALMAPIRSYTFDCVRLPRPPLHGRVRYVKGTIKARLRCSNPGEDLPLNAPGNGGILTCDPAKKTFDFSTTRLPKCLPYRKPGGLRMPVRFAFTLSQCNDRITADVTDKMTERIRTLVPMSCSKVLTGAKCTWENIRTRCGNNYNKGVDDSKKLLTMEAELVMHAYALNITLDAYARELDMIQTVYLTKARLTDVNIPSVRFYKMSLSKSWKASCDEYSKTTVGTTLNLHKVASCRGCPVVYWLDDEVKKCWQCDRGLYTKEPYSKQCIPCGRVEYWQSEEEYIRMCGSLK